VPKGSVRAFSVVTNSMRFLRLSPVCRIGAAGFPRLFLPLHDFIVNRETFGSKSFLSASQTRAQFGHNPDKYCTTLTN
jgi:hypothetical protein